MTASKNMPNPVTIQLLSSSKPVLEYIRPSHWWQKASYRLYFPLKAGDMIIPEGFTTHLASIPKLLLSLMPANIDYLPVIIRHEFEINNYSSYKKCVQANKNCKQQLIQQLETKKQLIPTYNKLASILNKYQINILYLCLKISTLFKFISTCLNR